MGDVVAGDRRRSAGLAGDHDTVGGRQRFTGDAHPARVPPMLRGAREEGVDDFVGDAVADLVGMTFRNRFAGEQIARTRHGRSPRQDANPLAPPHRCVLAGRLRASRCGQGFWGIWRAGDAGVRTEEPGFGLFSITILFDHNACVRTPLLGSGLTYWRAGKRWSGADAARPCRYRSRDFARFRTLRWLNRSGMTAVSSTKTSRAGSNRPCWRIQRHARCPMPALPAGPRVLASTPSPPKFPARRFKNPCLSRSNSLLPRVGNFAVSH